MIATYDDFLIRVEELGFMAFSKMVPGLPSLVEETYENQWHTGNPETDPWQWKDRAAADKKIAFGCLLGGHKGFITKSLYPYFYTACHPKTHMEERYSNGEIPQVQYKLWQLFEDGAHLDTGEIRTTLGNGFAQAKIDSAIVQLQREFHITVSGNRRKLNKLGEPYGWPANTYQRVTSWALDGWLDEAFSITKIEAAAAIIETAQKGGKQVDSSELVKKLKLNP